MGGEHGCWRTPCTAQEPPSAPSELTAPRPAGTGVFSLPQEPTQPVLEAERHSEQDTEMSRRPVTALPCGLSSTRLPQRKWGDTVILEHRWEHGRRVVSVLRSDSGVQALLCSRPGLSQGARRPSKGLSNSINWSGRWDQLGLMD